VVEGSVGVTKKCYSRFWATSFECRQVHYFPRRRSWEGLSDIEMWAVIASDTSPVANPGVMRVLELRMHVDAVANTCEARIS